MTASLNLLELNNVHVRYPDRDGRLFTVLNDIDLRVKPGEFITLVGPSGCGKSTLLRLILGSQKPTQGSVLLNGDPIEAPDRDRGIVFQKYSLFPHLTVLENVMFGLDAEAFHLGERLLRYFHYRKAREGYRKEARRYLERVGLAADGDKYPHQLSGGMRQRVAIIQSMIMRPMILLMDEPFGALDDSTRQDMQLFILEQWEETGMTVFFVTHDLDEACFLGSRVLVLSQYYSSDQEGQEGAKFVADLASPFEHPKPTDFKYSKEMKAMVAKIRKEGLDPDFRQHLRDFDLSHRDAYRLSEPEPATPAVGKESRHP